MDDLSKTMAARPSAEKTKGPTRWKSIALALIVPLGMIAVLWFVFRARLIPAIPVEVGRVLYLEQESTAAATSAPGATELLFQASGWIEPDPWHVDVAVKTDGFIEEVFFKEGEGVTNGQLLATLDDTDARLNYAVAVANTRKQEAALTAANSAALAAEKQAEAATFRVEAAVARLTGERDTWERFSKTPSNAVSLSERTAAEQAVVEFEAEEKAARAALKALEAKVEEAESGIGFAAASLELSLKQLETAKLALDRTKIYAETDGMILLRLVNPGDKRVMRSDATHSAVIASVYDPKQLQVRVDVPIAEAGKLIPGQPARISTAMLPGATFTGRVTRVVGQADLQRNTLQVKVAIDAPDSRMRPDVLCRVEFWSDGNRATATGSPSGGHALWIPEQALNGDGSNQNVWVIDPLTRAVSKRAIELAPSTRDGLRRVVDGVRANEQVVLSATKPLNEGARVREAK